MPDTLESIVLTAYDAAMAELGSVRGGWGEIQRRLGDLDAQASNPEPATRFGLAGQLIAAAQLIADEPSAPRDAVVEFVQSRLDHERSERDDAAPRREARVPPEQDLGTGLKQVVEDETRSHEENCWLAASLILQFLVRPALDVERLLGLREQLRFIGEHASSLLADAGPFGLADESFDGLLAHLEAKARYTSDPETRALVRTPPDEPWIHIAAAAAAASSVWRDEDLARSMRRIVDNAAERLAGSRVPETPGRYPVLVALDHARQVAFDAATTSLGLLLRPGDDVLREMNRDVEAQLVEVGGSGLIGAWVMREKD